ncbi:hypothetical protein M3Y95_01278800 [Aphelenchoides besseyi]|nr:hypothetical protein M3Y95_01278800 [Aphelenchoides besseyi]
MSLDVLRVAYPPNFPSVSSRCKEFPPMKVTQNCPYPGMIVEIFHLLGREMNMRIEPVIIDEFVNNEHNDTLHLGLEMIQNNDIDTIALGIQRTKERSVNLSFTTPLYKTQSRLLFRKSADLYSGLWDFFRAYETETWLIMLGALIVQCCLCIIIRRTEAKMKNVMPIGIVEVSVTSLFAFICWFSTAWHVLRLQFLQPEPIVFYSAAGKLSIMFFSLVQVVVLLGVFGSWILSNILQAETTPLPTMNHLIKQITNRELQVLTTQPTSWLHERIRSSPVYPFAELRTALARNPIQISRSINETLDRVAFKNGVVFVQDDDETLWLALKRCGVEYREIHTGLPILDARLVFRKNDSRLAIFDDVINKNTVHIARIVRKYNHLQNRLTKCWTKQKVGDPVKEKPLGLRPYFGVLIVCGAIMIIAAAVLVCEVLYQRYQMGKEKEKRRAKYSTSSFVLHALSR